jgi:hypothetical protein
LETGSQKRYLLIVALFYEIGIRELEALALRETAVWENVEALIQKGTSKSYDEVVPLLLKLRDLADYQNQPANFLTRLKQLHAQYSSRSGLKRRLLEANL